MYVARELKDFKNNSGPCLEHTFSKDWSEADGIKEITSGEATLETASESKGCLVFNWDKEKKDTNWKGSNFRFVWTVARGKSGFAVYLTGTLEDNNAVKFEGIGYWFKQGDGDKWKAEKKLEIAGGSKTLNTSDLADKFPQLGDKLQIDGAKSKYWGFLKDEGKEVQTGDKDEIKVGKWEWKSGNDGEELKSWSTNLEAWWKHFFDESKWKMTDVVSSLKGTWTSASA